MAESDESAVVAADAGSDMRSQTESTLAGATKILRTYGFTATADAAAAKTSGGHDQRTVVVVGEVNRGKSSLVNALVGVWGVSPVDVDVTTSATISLVPAGAEHPPGSADLVFPGAVRRIGFDEVADWVSAAGRHVADTQGEVLPTRAIVPVSSPHLQGFVVVDTPGSGGLNAVRAQLSVQSAQQAGVIVVVCDATSPLTAPEMEFIRTCTATVEAVIVVVTKTDKNLRRWKPIVEENRRLLRTHLRRTIPVLGVSSVRALAAADIADPIRRGAAEDASGITALRTLIQSSLNSDHRAQVDGLRTALEGLRKVHAKITADIAVTEEGSRRATGTGGAAGPAHRAESAVDAVGAVPRPRPRLRPPSCLDEPRGTTRQREIEVDRPDQLLRHGSTAQEPAGVHQRDRSGSPRRDDRGGAGVPRSAAGHRDAALRFRNRVAEHRSRCHRLHAIRPPHDRSGR